VDEHQVAKEREETVGQKEQEKAYGDQRHLRAGV
jgi:hypothetical protein